jgi:hypothetical protein
MKHTAVEWLVKMLYSPVGKGFIEGRRQIPHDIIEKAKAMDKERMIEFANNYGFHICGYDYERAEQYYNETYGDDT